MEFVKAIDDTFEKAENKPLSVSNGPDSFSCPAFGLIAYLGCALSRMDMIALESGTSMSITDHLLAENGGVRTAVQS